VREDDEYLVENTLGWLVDDVDQDETYAMLSDSERAAVLALMVDRTVRAGGIEEWIAAHGPRCEDTIQALHRIGAHAHGDFLQSGFALFPDRLDADPQTRLQAMRSWSPAHVDMYQQAEDGYLDAAGRKDIVDRFLLPFIDEHITDFPRMSRICSRTSGHAADSVPGVTYAGAGLGAWDAGAVTAGESPPWLDDAALQASPVVANCLMNRERQLRGVNSYARELGFDPRRFPHRPDRPGPGPRTRHREAGQVARPVLRHRSRRDPGRTGPPAER
jgi:hypothetical protein